MSFYDRVTLAFLEEDNAQRAFFRLRPLLNSAGPCTQEELSVLPDEGFVRIVPDKNEQANFKDRMRTLGHLCMIDLTPFPPEANKIRTNKNYAPDKGEKNQYILYSDVIHALPESLVYEVMDAESAEEIPEKVLPALTPLKYVRVKDQWYGPIGPGLDIAAVTDAPLEKQLHSLSFPDGKQHLFYWPVKEVAECMIDEDEEPLTMANPVIKESEPHLVAMESSAMQLSGYARAPVVQMPVRAAVPEDAVLSGTPLYANAMPHARLNRTRNPLHEVVDAQWRAAKYDAPSAQLQQGANLRHVNNPLEQFKEIAEETWSIPEAQQQVFETLLALPGMQKRLEKMFHAGEPDSLLVASMRHQLQELEAERLTLLIQLDKARENKAAFREEVLAAAQQEHTVRLKQLREEIAACQEAEAALTKQLQELIDQRSALQAVCDELMRGDLPVRLQAFAKGYHLTMDKSPLPIRLSPAIGTKAQPARMIAALQDAFFKEWDPLKQEDAVHFLTLFALCPKIQLVHPSLAETARYARLCMETLGLTAAFAIQSCPDQSVVVDALGCAMSPVCVATPHVCPEDASASLKTLLLSKSPTVHLNHLSYELAPWPVLILPEAAQSFQNTPSSHAGEALPPISMESLREFSAPQGTISQEVKRWLVELKEVMAAAQQPLPWAVGRVMTDYLSAAGSWMQGGIAAAADYAFLAWIVPLALSQEKLLKALRPLLPSLPRSGAILRQCM
jgi:hypothetical protein